MSFTRITETELAQRGATILPNQPTNYSATQLKQEFDAPAKNIIAPKFNTLVGELEATTASGSLGAVAPTGRTGTTIQGVLESISADLENAEAEAHTHTNKAILDDYTQTETDLADAVAKKHEHTNKVLLDTYTQADGDIADAVTKKHDHSNKALLDTYTQVDADLADAVSKKHNHSNKAVLDDLSDSSNKLAYKGGTLANNAYKSVKVTSEGTSTTIDASGEDSFELYAGANVTLSVDTTSTPKKITVNSSGGGGGGGSYTAGNGIDISGSTISVDYGTVDSSTTTKPPTGKAVYDAIAALDGTITGAAGTGKTLKTFSQTDGVVAAEFDDISITKSQISNLASEAAASGGTTTSLCTTGEKYEWNNKVDSVSVGSTGTASSTAVAYQRIGVGDAGGAVSYDEIKGTKYMERTSESATSYVFTNSDHILSTSVIEVYVDTWGDNPSNVVVDGSAHTCTVTFPSAKTRSVRIYIK